jgi:outer membrane immunogenic protein
MKKLALAATAVAALSGQALAADMPMKAVRPAPVVAAVSWTGCYVGGGGGYGMYYQENRGYDEGRPVNPNSPFAVRTQITDTFSTGGKGWFGTVQAGCDYQFNTGPWAIVVGAFGDYDFADIKGRRTDPLGFFLPGVGNETMTDAWSVGGRIGVLVTPQLLAYFSGGYSEARFSSTNYTNLFGPPFGINTLTYTQGSTFKGWFVGAGDEYALSFLPGLYWKTEARAYHYDRQTQFNYFQNTNIRTGSSYDAEKWVYSVRSELVYRFNFGGGAVVAKY